MSVFIVVVHDSVVQIGDKVRFDLTKSFCARPLVTSTFIKQIDVKPNPTSAWIKIHDATIPAEKLAVKDWYFDWIYLDDTGAAPHTHGHIQTFEVRFTDINDDTYLAERDFTLWTEAQDNLFSNDQDLIAHEPDILKWLPDGRSSWKYVHRRCQQRILSYLFEKGYKNTDGTPFEKDQIVEKYDVKEWSTFMALKIIFGSIINSKDDVFLQKAKFYENLEGKANKTDIRVDLNADGTQAVGETISTHGPILVRR